MLRLGDVCRKPSQSTTGSEPGPPKETHICKSVEVEQQAQRFFEQLDKCRVADDVSNGAINVHGLLQRECNTW
jgi:hypothetical protein